MSLPPILVLAGGMGTRVTHLSGGLPKCLIPINGRTFIDLQLDLFELNGISKVIFSVGYKEDEIRNHLEKNLRENLEIVLVSDGPVPLGTGGAIVNSLDFLGEEFLVIYGDSYLTTDFHSFYTFAKAYESCITYFHNDNKFDKSNVKKTKRHLVSYMKSNPDLSFQYIDYGLEYFKRDFFANSSKGEPFDLADRLESASESGNLHGYEVFERFYEIGSESGIIGLESKLSTGK